MSDSVYERLLRFLSRLEEHKISYSLEHVRAEAIMVEVAVPGERWEVEFPADGSVDVERFVSTGSICGEDALADLFAAYAG